MAQETTTPIRIKTEPVHWCPVVKTIFPFHRMNTINLVYLYGLDIDSNTSNILSLISLCYFFGKS